MGTMVLRVTVGTAAALCLVCGWSCVRENVVGTGEASRSDTSRVYDTTTVCDTVAMGDTDVIYLGVAYDFSAYDTLDSAYVELVAFANPRREDLSVRVNNHALRYGETTPKDVFFDANSLAMFALIPGAIYRRTVPAEARYRYVVAKPVYAEDSIASYDTSRAAVDRPGAVYPFVLSGPDTTYAPAEDSTRYEYVYHYRWDDTSLTLRWDDGADYYALYAERLASSVYGRPTPVGEPIEIFVTDTQYTFGRAFVFQDSSTPAEEAFNYLWIDLQPVNGPVPSAWDTLPSFGSRGLLLGLRYEPYSVYLVPENPEQSQAKQPRGMRYGPEVPRDPRERPAWLRRAVAARLSRKR